MKVWETLHALFTAGGTTQAAIALGLSVLVLLVVLVIRRLLPQDDRRKALSAILFLALSMVVGGVRLGLEATGLANRMVGRALGILETIFLGLGVALIVFQLVFEVVPRRFDRRVPPIIHEIVLMVTFVVIVLGAFGEAFTQNVSSVIATSAVLTAVIGLALQSTLTNLFAGLALQMDRALSIGDWIQVGDRVGRIVEIRWRSASMRTRDGDMVLVPNSRLLVEEVHNYSRPSPHHRTTVTIGLHYRHPPNEVCEALTAAVRGTPGVLPEPAPDAFPLEFGDSSITYLVRFWIDDFARLGDIEGAVRTRLWYAARRTDLEIPFPIRTVLMHQESAESREAEARAERKRRLDVLAGVDLFAALEPSDREMLADGMRLATFAAGQAIIEQGAPGDSLYVIVKGCVRVSLAHGTASRDLATLGPGQIIGEMSLLTGEPRAASCWAEGDVTCYVVGHEAMRRILIASPHVADVLAEELAGRQAAVQKESAALTDMAARRSAGAGLVTKIRQFFDLG